MNKTTTTMEQQRRGLAPNKRKHSEFQQPSKFIKPSHHHRATATNNNKPEPLAQKNQLLAGYMAYEFLNKGTLLGQPWDQIRAEAKPGEPSKSKLLVEVSTLLKENGGVQIPGVFNPTQLARFSQL